MEREEGAVPTDKKLYNNFAVARARGTPNCTTYRIAEHVAEYTAQNPAGLREIPLSGYTKCAVFILLISIALHL